MKKQGLTVLLTASMVLAMGSTAFGAEWKQDGYGWCGRRIKEAIR